MRFRSSRATKVVFLLAIGATVFAAHRWWTVQHDGEPIPAAPPEELFEQVELTLEQLATVDTRTSDVAAQATADQTGELIRDIDRASAQLLAGSVAPDSPQARAARAARVKAYFLAAQQRPDTYARRFDTLAQELVQDFPGSTEAIEASILRFAVVNDLTKPLNNETFQAMKRQASGYSNSRNGAALYSFVSHQLYTNGQIESARAVLDAGTNQYRGQPGWNQLFEQKFQQGHLTLPTPTTPGGVFQSNVSGGGGPAAVRRS